MKKRILTLALILAMTLALVPAAVAADAKDAEAPGPIEPGAAYDPAN